MSGCASILRDDAGRSAAGFEGLFGLLFTFIVLLCGPVATLLRCTGLGGAFGRAAPVMEGARAETITDRAGKAPDITEELIGPLELSCIAWRDNPYGFVARASVPPESGSSVTGLRPGVGFGKGLLA